MATHTIPRLFTKQQAADSLGISRATIDRLSTRGELNPIKLGRLVRFSEPDLLALLGRGQVREPLQPAPHPADDTEMGHR
jgi:excisionase family DNA binding protein